MSLSAMRTGPGSTAGLEPGWRLPGCPFTWRSSRLSHAPYDQGISEPYAPGAGWCRTLAGWAPSRLALPTSDAAGTSTPTTAIVVKARSCQVSRTFVNRRRHVTLDGAVGACSRFKDGSNPISLARRPRRRPRGPNAANRPCRYRLPLDPACRRFLALSRIERKHRKTATSNGAQHDLSEPIRHRLGVTRKLSAERETGDNARQSFGRSWVHSF